MSRSIVKFIVCLTVVVGFAASSFAQEDNTIHPITKSGSAAFVFDLAGIGTFGIAPQAITQTLNSKSPTGGLIAGAGAKWFIADMMAVKELLAFGTTSNGDKAALIQPKPSTIGIVPKFENNFMKYNIQFPI